MLVVVEVKWRRASAASEGAVSAWPPAQRRRAAEAWLSLHPGFQDGESRPWRFDLVTIDEDERGLRLEHRRGAWSPGAGWW